MKNEIPKDVISRIKSDYPGKKDQDFVIKELSRLQNEWNSELKSARVLRCVIYLAEGDMNSFNRYINAATVDWRDVIYWAEYDGDFENHNVKHVRNFDKTFEENEL